MAKWLRWDPDFEELTLWGKYRVDGDLIYYTAMFAFVISLAMAAVGVGMEIYWMTIPFAVGTLLVVVGGVTALVWVAVIGIRAWAKIIRDGKSK